MWSLIQLHDVRPNFLYNNGEGHTRLAEKDKAHMIIIQVNDNIKIC